MASSSDEEEARRSFLESDHSPEEPSQRSRLRQAQKSILGAALVLGVLAAAAWATSGPAQRRQIPVRLPAHVEEKVAVDDTAIDPEAANLRNANRQPLIVEQDLETFLHTHVGGRQAHFPGQLDGDGPQACLRQAERLFDEVAEESDMEDELTDTEFMLFRRRFAAAMQRRCKDLISQRLWLKVAGEELEQQKPLATAALVASLNEANLGFKANLHEWLLHETAASFQQRLGLLPTPKGQKDVLKRPPHKRRTGQLPAVFRAELKWPHCREEILRIHNQGHCGSCWAFGGLASIDARMCIASNGKWDASADILSRLHVTSCAPDNYWAGHDGCQGGFPHWPMEFMANTGVVSTSCLPYYISGEGSQHFQHQDRAPPCEEHCQGGYSLPMRNDTFSSAGVANYDWIQHVHGDAEKVSIMKAAIYEEGPVAFAFYANHAFMGYSNGVFSVCTGHDQANHAVYAFGWGVVAHAEGGDAVEYIEASNSWGPHWGANGHFRIHPRCVTDVTIPGSIENSVVGHHVGTVDPDVPRDPDNEFWPWPKPDECPFSNGCVTDMEVSGNYSNNEHCISKKLNGKRIRVVEFDLEFQYDILKVNGKSYTGSRGGGLDESLDGLLVDDDGLLSFTSDFSVNKAGFKLCAQ